MLQMVLPLSIAGLTALVLAGLAWRRRRAISLKLFALLMLGVAIWAIGYALELASPTLVAKIWWAKFEYLGIASIPAVWLLFILHYTGRGRYAKKAYLGAFLGMPALTILLVWTNELHRLVWAEIGLETSGLLSLFAPTYGIWFWIHSGVSYLYLLAGAVLLLRAFTQSPDLYRGQMRFMLIAVLAPWIGNALYLAGFSPIPQLDLTPFGFTISGLAVAWALFRFQFLDIVPTAHNAIVSGLPDAIMVLDNEARIVEINPAASALLELPKAAVVGQIAGDVLADQEELVAKFKDVLSTQSQIVMKGQDEKSRTYDMRISPLTDEQGQPAGRIIVLHDITERLEAEEVIKDRNAELEKANLELSEARQTAETASRLKSEFLASISHELRTPLNAIIGYTQLQLAGVTGDLTDEQRMYQERTIENARDLLNLINGVLDLSKIEAGRLVLVESTFVIRDLMGEVERQMAGLAEEKGLSLQVTIEDEMPVMQVADASRIKQIAINLISNAIKFTDEGRVSVQITPQGKREWHLIVSDTGIGIPSHAQEYIFDEFRQIDGTSERRYGGTGLGLSIVKKLAVMMGGSIWVRSHLNEGSTFTLRLPLVVSETEPSTQE